MNIIESIIIAIVEGITEYIPISSTGHMIITEKLLGVEETDFVKKELINHGYTDLIIEMIINEGSLMGNIKTSKAKSEIVNINLTL